MCNGSVTFINGGKLVLLIDHSTSPFCLFNAWIPPSMSVTISSWAKVRLSKFFRLVLSDSIDLGGGSKGKLPISFPDNGDGFDAISGVAWLLFRWNNTGVTLCFSELGWWVNGVAWLFLFWKAVGLATWTSELTSSSLFCWRIVAPDIVFWSSTYGDELGSPLTLSMSLFPRIERNQSAWAKVGKDNDSHINSISKDKRLGFFIV